MLELSTHVSAIEVMDVVIAAKPVGAVGMAGNVVALDSEVNAELPVALLALIL